MCCVVSEILRNSLTNHGRVFIFKQVVSQKDKKLTQKMSESYLNITINAEFSFPHIHCHHQLMFYCELYTELLLLAVRPGG